MSGELDFPAEMNEIIATLYDNIDAETPWTDALERLRVFLGTNCVCLRLSQSGARHREHLFVVGPMVRPERIAAWEDLDIRALGPVPLAPGEHIVVDWAQHSRDPALTAMLRKNDTRQMLTMCVDRFGDTDCFLNCDRGAAQDDFSREDIRRFRIAGGHFGRAIRLRRKLASAHVVSQFKSEALDRLATAVFIVTPIGEARALNGCAAKLIEERDCFFIRDRALHVRDSRADRRLQKAIVAAIAAEGRNPPQILSIAAPRREHDRALLIVGAPTVSLLTNRPETCVLMFVRDDIGLGEQDGALLQDLFALTPAETSVAMDLANGRSLEELSAALGISKNTARAHLRSIFLKMGLRRQADIVHILSNSVVPLGRRSPAAPAASDEIVDTLYTRAASR